MADKKKGKLPFVDIRQEVGEYHDDYVTDRNEKPSSTDLRKRMRRLKARHSLFMERYVQLFNISENVVESVIRDFKKDYYLKPYHYALILVGGRKYFKVWYTYLTKELINELQGKERVHLLMKTLLTFKPIMTKAQIQEIMDSLLEHHNPGVAVLLDYYFNEIIPHDRRKIVNYLITEIDYDKVELYVADFETKTRDFFRDVNVLMK